MGIEKKHARLGPSGWDWWSNCPGAPALSDGLPNITNAYAAEGSVAHLVADKVMTGEIGCASEMLDQIIPYEGFDILVDEEMVDSVNLYVDLCREHIGDGILMPEQPVPIGHLTGETGAEGTADCIGITNDGKRLVVIDLKYGKGVRVNAESNGQAKLYALGAMHKFAPVYEDIEEVEVVIVQPRLEEGVTSEILSIGEMEEFRDEVEIAAGRVSIADGEMPSAGPNPDGRQLNDNQWEDMYLSPGEKQCRFCNAKGICPKIKEETSKALALVSTATVEDFADLTMPKQAASVFIRPDVSNEKLAEFQRAVPLIEEAISGVRAEIERRLFEGQDVPGFYLGEGRKGHRKWTDPEAVKKAIVKRGRLTKDQAYTQKLISPTQAEKLLGKDVMTILTKDGLVVQPDGKPSVCQEGDKNKPYVPVTADDFADLSAQSEAERLLS